MSLYDRDSGDEDDRPRRIIQGCKDGLCGATDCPRCGHETAVDEGETWAGRCARIERLRKQSLATGVPIVTAVQGGGVRPGEMAVLMSRSNVGRSVLHDPR